jgi:hypothetical protein
MRHQSCPCEISVDGSLDDPQPGLIGHTKTDRMWITGRSSLPSVFLPQVSPEHLCCAWAYMPSMRALTNVCGRRQTYAGAYKNRYLLWSTRLHLNTNVCSGRQMYACVNKTRKPLGVTCLKEFRCAATRHHARLLGLSLMPSFLFHVGGKHRSRNRSSGCNPYLFVPQGRLLETSTFSSQRQVFRRSVNFFVASNRQRV